MYYEDNMMPTPHYPPMIVHRVLRQLGADIRDARRLRRLPMTIIAERAFTTRATLQRIEQGDPSVSMGIYASVLQALGLLDNLAHIAHISHDVTGQTLASAELPKRSRLAKPKAV